MEKKSKIYTTPFVASPRNLPFWKSAPPLYPHRVVLKLVAAAVVTPFHLPIYERSLSYLLTRRFTARELVPRITVYTAVSRKRKRKFSSLTRFSDPRYRVATGFRDNRARKKKKKKGKEGDIARE